MRRRRPAWLLVLLPLLAVHCASNSTGASLSVTVLEPAEGALVLDDALDVRANVACGSDQALECGLRSHVQLCIGIGAHDTHALPLYHRLWLCTPHNTHSHNRKIEPVETSTRGASDSRRGSTSNAPAQLEDFALPTICTCAACSNERI